MEKEKFWQKICEKQEGCCIVSVSRVIRDSRQIKSAGFFDSRTEVM